MYKDEPSGRGNRQVCRDGKKKMNIDLSFFFYCCLVDLIGIEEVMLLLILPLMLLLLLSLRLFLYNG